MNPNYTLDYRYFLIFARLRKAISTDELGCSFKNFRWCIRNKYIYSVGKPTKVEIYSVGQPAKEGTNWVGSKLLVVEGIQADGLKKAHQDMKETMGEFREIHNGY
ncbi:hypothetical protein C5167_042201 [Papaver somniferum]|uniref:Uncharacterized protein n=1 Tax=Papaver somniferum TaxID=3469 RepID=A0A4Y7L3V1_PAPSO|nr:hypothetical protein C5167_042201 [Papaver somniferum]